MTSPNAAAATGSTLRGIMWMCLASVLFAVMHVMVRIVSEEIHALEIAFFRNVFGLLVFAPTVMASGLLFLRTERIRLHAVRGVVNVFAMLMFFTALTIAPLAQVTALGFTAPLFAAILSVIFLGEVFRARRWTAIALGFLGTMVILRPGLIPIDLGSALVLGSAALWAVTLILIKMLSRTETSLTIAAWMNIFLAVFSLIPALLVWVTPSLTAFFWLILIGLSGTGAQVLMTQALKEADPTAVMPFDFTKLIWVAILAAWLFDEVPDVWTFVGAFIVFGATFYLAVREAIVSRGKA